mgnify:CR=1 FL=1
MNKLDLDYQKLLKDILKNGVEKSDRTGTGTISVFGRQIRHDMAEGFPLLTTKKMPLKTIMTELKWFCKGDTNIKYLVDNGCNIWNGDAFQNFLNKSEGAPDIIWNQEQFINKIKTDDEFAAKHGELGPIYGKQWRNWTTEVFEKDEESKKVFHATKQIDQIQNLINDLKTNPDSRRLMVSAWNPADQPEMALPPCHYGFQVYTRDLSFDERYRLYMGKDAEYNGNAYGKISTMDILDDADVPTKELSLMWTQRSTDVPLGLPFNIASYGMLLELLAKEVGMVAGELIGNLGDCHIYNNQVKGVKQQLIRDSYPLPTLTKLDNVEILNGEFDYAIEYYQSHPTIAFPLSN